MRAKSGEAGAGYFPTELRPPARKRQAAALPPSAQTVRERYWVTSSLCGRQRAERSQAKQAPEWNRR